MNVDVTVTLIGEQAVQFTSRALMPHMWSRTITFTSFRASKLPENLAVVRKSRLLLLNNDVEFCRKLHRKIYRPRFRSKMSAPFFDMIL